MLWPAFIVHIGFMLRPRPIRPNWHVCEQRLTSQQISILHHLFLMSLADQKHGYCKQSVEPQAGTRDPRVRGFKGIWHANIESHAYIYDTERACLRGQCRGRFSCMKLEAESFVTGFQTLTVRWYSRRLNCQQVLSSKTL